MLILDPRIIGVQFDKLEGLDEAMSLGVSKLMLLAADTRIGRYQIRSLLGKGGMGEVYLAQDTTLHRVAAIKLLRGTLTTNSDLLQRFHREAYAASSLNHPNILTVYEIGVENGLNFIATEFIEGESLRHRLGRGHIQMREVLDIGLQTASALSAAHAAGIVHRDIKPENIMIRRDGFVKVLDFGLAKPVAQEDSALAGQAPTITEDTAPGMVMGTVRYMSPEQARGTPVDARSDLFSLGVVLYELVALAHAVVSVTYSNLAIFGAVDPKEATAKAKAAAQKALELDPALDQAHAALAAIKKNEWDWVGAKRNTNGPLS